MRAEVKQGREIFLEKTMVSNSHNGSSPNYDGRFSARISGDPEALIHKSLAKLDQTLADLEKASYLLRHRANGSHSDGSVKKAVRVPAPPPLLEVEIGRDHKGPIAYLDGTEVRLTEQQMRLIRFLGEAPLADDGIASGRAVKETMDELDVTRKGLWTVVWRLRNFLEANGFPRGLLANDSPDQIRLLVRKFRNL